MGDFRSIDGSEFRFEKKFKKRKMSAPEAKKAKLEQDDHADPESLEVQKYQDQLEELNEKASEEILKVEQKYNKQRKPLFQKRQEAIHKLNKSKGVNFWAIAFGNHPFLSPMMNESEIAMMSHLTEIDVVEDEDIKSGYSITFKFDSNEHFTNDKLVKKFHMTPEGNVENSTTKINWKPNMNPMEKKEDDEEDIGFTEWLTEDSTETSDEVAELIKDDLWVNPFQYYLGLDDDEEDEDEEVQE